MKKLIPVCLFILSATRATYAQSLAEVAKQEEERRKTIQTTGRVYTNKDVKEAPPAPASVPIATSAKPASDKAEQEAQVPSDVAGTTTEDTKTPPESNVNLHRDEKHWRERASNYRTRLNNVRSNVEAVESKIEALRAMDQTPSNRGEARLAEQDLVKFKNQLASLEKEWSRIEEQARLSKVPSSWLQ